MPRNQLTLRRTVLALLPLLFALAIRVHAADITVDGVACTLADAIYAANSDEAVAGCSAGDGDDTITLSVDITLTADLPEITSQITIEGANHFVSGDDTYAMFVVKDADLTVNDLTIKEGNGINGGGIYISDGELIMDNVVIRENSARDHGGGIYVTGSRLEITGDSEISHNVAGDTAGGIYSNNSIVFFVDAEVSENETSSGGGGGLYFTSDSIGFTLSIMTSTFKKNTARLDGGGLRISNAFGNIVRSSFTENSADDGGGIKIYNSTLSIENTTISTNTARVGAGLSSLGSELTLTHVTLAYNTATEHGGGLLINGSDGSLKIRNTLITGTKSGGDCDSGPNADMITENAGNLIQDDSCAAAEASESTDTIGVQEEETVAQVLRAESQQAEETGQVEETVEEETEKVDARLGSLTGEAAYHPLNQGSPAIDMAVEEYCLEVDQPGTARPQGGICDVGAYELPVIVPTETPRPTATATQMPTETATPFPTATPIPTATASPTATPVNCVHTVAGGENLFRVALLYGTTVEAIRDLNRLTGDTVRLGQELLVPECEIESPICNGLPDDVIFEPKSIDVGCQVIELSDIDKHPLMNAGVVLAFDIWGRVAVGVKICFAAGGSVVFMDKSVSPPDVTRMTSYRADDKICVDIIQPGTVVLVAPLTEESSIPLTGCQVTTTNVVRLRETAGGAKVRALVPYNIALTAKARTAGWFNVEYLGMDGWVSAEHVSTDGLCA